MGIQSVLMRSVVVGAMIVSTVLAGAYPRGIMPANADVLDALAQWERLKEMYITTDGCPNKSTMLRLATLPEKFSNGEYQGYAFQLASMLEPNDEMSKKLWAYTEHFLNHEDLMPWMISESGEVTGKNAAPDGCMDIMMGLDRAGLRWDGVSDQAATQYTKSARVQRSRLYDKGYLN